MSGNQNKQSGFTLIELLVVISIIGILATVIYASFNGAREQARNRALMTELREVQLALEVYRAQNRRYPAAGSYPNDLRAALIPTFIGDLPLRTDSKNPNCSIAYTTDGTGSYYKLTAIQCYEGVTAAANGMGVNDEFARCPSSCGTCAGAGNALASYSQTAPFYESLAVYSAGGECQ